MSEPLRGIPRLLQTMPSSADEMDADTPPEHDFEWPKAKKMKSSLITCEERLRDLCKSYGISDEFEPFCAGAVSGPSTPPPEGSNAICVYEGMLEAGVRFPLHEFYEKVLQHYNLAPSQLSPNAWRYLVGFVLLCEGAAGVEPIVAAFLYFFELRALKRGDDMEGWYYFMPTSWPNGYLFSTLSSPLDFKGGWTQKFFFLRSASLAMPWRCPMEWGRPSRSDLVITDADWVTIGKLTDVAGVDVMKLLDKSRQEHSLPVHRPPVKTEASDGTESAHARTMKHKSPNAVTQSPPGFVAAGEPSATQMVLGPYIEKTEAELSQAKNDLQEARAKHAQVVARLEKDLELAKAERTAVLTQLKEEKAKLAAAKANHKSEVARLTKKLQAEHTQRTGDVAQLQSELAAAKAAVEKLEADKARSSAKFRRYKEKIQSAEAERAKAIVGAKAAEAERDMAIEEAKAAEAERDKKTKEANAQLIKVGELTGELQAARAEHAAVAQQLNGWLQATEAELEMHTTRSKAAVRELLFALYPGGDFDPAQLMAEVQSGSNPPGSPPLRAAKDQ